jgi:hypothetical protein
MGVEARTICAHAGPARSTSSSLMAMMGGFLRSRNCLRPRHASGGRSHKQRNVLSAIPRRARGAVQAELVGIWDQPTQPEALTQLAAENRQVCSALSGKRYEVWLRTRSMC